MQENPLANRFSKIFKVLTCFLLLALVTVSPVYADSGSADEKIALLKKIEWHFRADVESPDSQTAENLRQLQQDLKNGMSTKECCIHCHTDKRVK